jgi:hypothetical protein
MLLSLLLIAAVSVLLSGHFGIQFDQLATKSSEIQGLSAFLTLLFATAAAIGGAVATLRLANLGLSISEQQDARESIRFLEDRAREAIELYSRVIISASDVFAAGVRLDLSLPQFKPEEVAAQLQASVPDGVRAEYDNLSDHFSSLAENLRALARNDFAAYVVTQKGKGFHGELHEICTRLKQLGIPETEIDLRIHDLVDIAALLDVAAARLKEGRWSSVITARLTTNAAGIGKFARNYDNRNVRSFFFVGNILFARVEEGSGGLRFVASFGSAILRDLVLLQPNGCEIRNAQAARYSSIWPGTKGLIIEFDPANVLARTLASAIAEGEKLGRQMGSLYLLEAKA